MLRSCLRRPYTIQHAITPPTRIGLRVRNASTNKPPSTEPTPRKLLRYTLKPWAAPPLLARYPLAHQTVQFLIYGLAGCLAFHIFFEYFYVLEGAYGISMLPTIASSGDCLLISKYYRRGRQLGVGDVVSYKHPIKAGEYAVKRILGMPGDFVVAETPGKGVGRMIQVPEGHCWVVGDNLTWSRDSRMFGPLPLALVTGKVLAKCSPLWPTRLEHELKPAVIEEGDVD
ncbi:hypothetical protein LTR85_008736 [Meristemomyces frigidus]|nr:hypothetical protein LTR85_008736 [Meristemomyces frigidus]